MKMSLKYWVLAAALGMGITASAQEKDYSKTKQYQQGMREGQSDHTRNRDHSKKRHFKKDEDQKAYESGYQKGRNRN